MTMIRSRGYARNEILIGGVLLLEAGHFCATISGVHAALWSNIFQLLICLFTILICFRARSKATSALVKRCWVYVSLAFIIWSLAQSLYLHEMYHPALRLWGRSVDDALWLLVGLPLLIAVYPTLQDADAVGWLDKIQILITFLGLYCLVFEVSGRLTVGTAYTLQNFLLALCCFVRMSAGTSDRERRFFAPLAVFLTLYATLDASANVLLARGWQAGTPLDLVYTSPFMVFCVMVLRGAHPLGVQQRSSIERDRSLSRLHSLSIGILPALAIGTSAHIAYKRPVIGSLLLGIAFITFLLRVVKRETSWQAAHRILEETVLKDALTGLGNRILLRRTLQNETDRRAEEDGQVVLIFADLDKFKAINDTLGHEEGDKLLVQIGKRLSETSPPSATVCRLGGDEFVVLTQAADLASAETMANNLLEAIRQPIQLGRHTIRCTASLGVVFAANGEPGSDLLRAADVAMYRAKQAGKNRVTLFKDAWHDAVNTRWQMEADLRLLLQSREIQVAFQPIVDLHSAEIRGFEALARWLHPVYGQVPPSEFIAIAEELGLIGDLGAQVIESACSQVARWNRLWGRSLYVSVNISPRQLSNPTLVAELVETLARTQLDPRCLKLEITESAMLVGMSDVKRVLNEIRQLGVQISLDDFGTGYSSLSFLLDLPVDEIKVDRSFVSNMQHASQRRKIVQTMVQLGQGLDKMIVAEGAETADDVKHLLTMKCSHVQGWVFCRAQDATWMNDNFAELNLQIKQQIEAIRKSQWNSIGDLGNLSPTAAARIIALDMGVQPVEAGY